MGVNHVIYNGTTLIDLTGDTVTEDTLAEGVVAHDKRGERIVGTMVATGGTSENFITEVGVMIGGEPVTIRDDGSRLTTVVNDDDSIVETRTFLDGATETKTTVFNDDDTVTETTVTNGETTTKVTTFTDFGEIVMRTDKGNKIHYGETEPDASVGIDGDVFICKTEEEIPDVTFVEWLESSGTQFINTGFVPNQNTRVVCNAVYTQNSSASYLFGSDGGSGVAYFAFGAANGNLRFAHNTSSYYFTSGLSFTDMITVDANKNVASINGIYSVTATSATFNSGYPLYLFGDNRKGSLYGATPAKIYSCQIYDNGTMVRDYVPARDKNNTPCLYDRLNGAFYYNAGSGSFSAPEKGHTVVDYIESSETQYIDTKFKPNNNTRVVLDAEFISILSKDIFGARTSATSKNYAFLYVDGNGFRSDYNNEYTQYWNTPTTGRQIIDKNKETTTVAGTSKSYTNAIFQCDYNLTLFTGNRAGDVSLKSSYKLYGCQIYDNGVLIRDYIPVVDADGVACLYDQLNHVYYRNAGTGAFSTNYVEPEESTKGALFMKINGTWTLVAGEVA